MQNMCLISVFWFQKKVIGGRNEPKYSGFIFVKTTSESYLKGEQKTIETL